jgi:hypothetical protein
VLRNHDWCYDVVRHGAESGHAGFTAYWQQAAERAHRTRRWYLQNMNLLQGAVSADRQLRHKHPESAPGADS